MRLRPVDGGLKRIAVKKLACAEAQIDQRGATGRRDVDCADECRDVLSWSGTLKLTRAT